MNAYKAWQTYKNGERVEDVQKQVLDVLKAVAEMEAHITAGREFSDREYRLTRELLDARMVQINGMSKRLDALEHAFRRPGCPRYHFRRGEICIDARNIMQSGK